MRVNSLKAVLASIFWCVSSQLQAENTLDPLRYIHGQWRCNHYRAYPTQHAHNFSQDEIEEIASSRLHIEKNGFYFDGALLCDKQFFDPETVQTHQMFDSDQHALSYEFFNASNSPLRSMLSQCRLGEFTSIYIPLSRARMKRLHEPGILYTLYLYRETLIIDDMGGYTLFMEKCPHMTETYRGTQSAAHTFLVPKHTSFILLSYEVEDAATALCVRTKRPKSATANSDKDALFETLTASTCGTKTVRLYVEPYVTQLSAEIKVRKGKGKWRIHMEAY